MERRLEDHIRRLCAKLISGVQGKDFEAIATELRASLTEHIERLRAKLRDYPMSVERRSGRGKQNAGHAEK